MQTVPRSRSIFDAKNVKLQYVHRQAQQGTNVRICSSCRHKRRERFISGHAMSCVRNSESAEKMTNSTRNNVYAKRWCIVPRSPWTNSLTYVPAEVSMSRMNMRLEISSEDIEWITFSLTSPVRRCATRSGVRCPTLSSVTASSLLLRPVHCTIACVPVENTTSCAPHSQRVAIRTFACASPATMDTSDHSGDYSPGQILCRNADIWATGYPAYASVRFAFCLLDAFQSIAKFFIAGDLVILQPITNMNNTSRLSGLNNWLR